MWSEGEIWLKLYLIRILQRPQLNGPCFTCRWGNVDKTEEKWREEAPAAALPVSVCQSKREMIDQLRVCFHLASRQRPQASMRLSPVSRPVCSWGTGSWDPYFSPEFSKLTGFSPLYHTLAGPCSWSRPAGRRRRNAPPHGWSASRGGRFKRGRNKWLTINTRCSIFIKHELEPCLGRRRYFDVTQVSEIRTDSGGQSATAVCRPNITAGSSTFPI